MKAIYILLAMAFLLVLTGNVAAAPFIGCNSYVAPAVIPDTFKYVIDGGAEQTIAAWSGTAGGIAYQNIIHADIGSVSVGNHVISIRACKNGDPIWNIPEACSNAVPFSFSRPAPSGSPPSAPSGGLLLP